MSQIILPYNDPVYDVDFYKDYGIFVKPITYPMSTRKIEALLEIAKIQKYLQCNPVKAIDLFFNIELLDSQALAVQRSWIIENILMCCTRGWGKSTTIDLSIMAKDMLFCDYWTYIASGSGSQAQNTFNILEKLANDNIDTFSGSTGKIFKDEVEIKNAAGDGFSHSSDGFNYNLYNGSMTNTLNANIDSKRGFRGSIIFDECAFLSEELIQVYSAFAIVNKSLKTGKDASGRSIDPIRQRCFPQAMPYQKIYISSAGSVDTKFYSIYRDFSKKMIMGDPNFAVLHIDCEQAFKPTIRGELIEPLLSKAQVDSEMRQNAEKARREYYCLFTTDGGADSIVRRGVITRNEEIRKPLLYNDTGDKKFIIAYDPARSRDNSIILVLEVYEQKQQDGSVDIRGRIANIINLIDVGKKIKSPMQTPDQIEYLKKVILEYNAGADAYGNIIGIYIDAGSGGGGVNIADYLMQDFTTPDGTIHRGLIDREYSAEYVRKFPNAIDKVHLMSPSQYKSIMYEAMIELLHQNKIGFTSSYDNKGYLTIFDVDEELFEKEKKKIEEKLRKNKLSDEELNQQVQEELKKADLIKTKNIKLDWRDELALVNIDALKEELVNIVRKRRDTGKDSFDLTPEKANKLHDDRAYTLCMASYALMELRRKEILSKAKKKTDAKDLISKLPIRQAKQIGNFD